VAELDRLERGALYLEELRSGIASRLIPGYASPARVRGSHVANAGVLLTKLDQVRAGEGAASDSVELVTRLKRSLTVAVEDIEARLQTFEHQTYAVFFS
jgi:hypothetical protein